MFDKKRYISLLVAAIALLTFASIVFAVHITVNTEDSAVDSSWNSVPVITDGDDFANDDYDIIEAWIGNDSSNNFYFRVNLADAGELPTDYSSLEARLDCNQDGDFSDAEDMVVFYALGASGLEDTRECQGNDWFQCNNAENNAATFGEVIPGTPNNYEWRADAAGTADWSSCLAQVNVQFASVDADGNELDVTTWRGYDTPTPVTLAGFTTQGSLLAPAAALVVGVVALGGLIVLRRRNG